MTKVQMTYDGKKLVLKDVVEVSFIENDILIFYSPKVKRAPELYETELIDKFVVL